MKKIKHYTGNSLDFYVKVRDSKRDEQLKASLRSIHPAIKNDYDSYDSAFASLQLHSLTPDASLSDAHRSQLSTLYKYKAVSLRKLMAVLTTNQYGQADTTCPFCMINSINSFDHILPQSEFKEYAVHPLNLMPCCTTCNDYKGDEWTSQNALQFLNLYQDDIPNVQYLFVDLSVVSGVIKAQFRVENQGNIDAALFSRIKHTYTQMYLCERFQERCFNVIKELSNSIQTYLANGLTTDVIKNVILAEVEGLRILYGYNYWIAILKEACCNDENAFHCLCTMK